MANTTAHLDARHGGEIGPFQLLRSVLPHKLHVRHGYAMVVHAAPVTSTAAHERVSSTWCSGWYITSLHVREGMVQLGRTPIMLSPWALACVTLVFVVLKRWLEFRERVKAVGCVRVALEFNLASYTLDSTHPRT